MSKFRSKHARGAAARANAKMQSLRERKSSSSGISIGHRWVIRPLSLALSILALTLATGSAEARRIALVIGNGSYAHAPVLRNPASDAVAVAKAFERMKFDEVKLATNLTADAMRRALIELASASAGAEIAVVYFAGHGIEVDGQNFLIPADAQLAQAASVELETLPLSAVTTAMSGARKLRLVIVDACRNNPFRARIASQTAGRKRSIGRGLARIEPGENELIAFAASAGAEADDGHTRHSPFTTALLTFVETPGLEIRFLFAEVRDEVLRLTQREQAPHVYGTLGRDRIYLQDGPSNEPTLPDPPRKTIVSPDKPSCFTFNGKQFCE